MRDADWKSPLDEAVQRAHDFLAGLPGRHVGSTATAEELRRAMGAPLPEHPSDPASVVAELAEAAEPGLVAIPSGRFFGFVMGGGTPTALAADWLTSTWDQNAGLFISSPAASVVEEVAGAWLAELLGLPDDVSVGFVTGGQMANFTALAAARHEVLRRVDWDVETRGLIGAPALRVVVGAERHSTIDRALRLLGLGAGVAQVVPVDDQGRMRPDALREVLAAGDDGPTIVCAQAGNVNTGAFDPVGDICDIGHEHGAWVHLDGAFGLWAAASPARRHLVDGVERADSWAADAHKWLNVPYDSGLVFCADAAAHRAAMGMSAGYLTPARTGERDGFDFNPEASRRARGIPVYAAVRALGRSGVVELVDRCCDLARRFADGLAAHDGVEILNDVVLNQVLVRFTARDGDHDAYTHQVVGRLQDDGTCWMSGTTWQGKAAMRISVSNWRTDEADVDASIQAILRCARAA